MRLFTVLLAVILFLLGLIHIAAVAIPSVVFGWLEIIDAALFILEPVHPAIPLPRNTG